MERISDPPPEKPEADQAAPQQRECLEIQFDHATLWLLVLFAIASRQTHILAIHQWITHHAGFLLGELGLRTRGGHARLPSQATLYRFIWRLDQHAELLEARARQWATLAPQAARLDPGPRQRRRESPALLSVFTHAPGLTVHQERLKGRESTQAKRLVAYLKAFGTFLVMGDAAYLDQTFARAVLSSSCALAYTGA